MTITKRVITIETRQRTVIRQNLRRTVWCEFCAGDVESLTPAQIAETFGIDSDEIYRLIENGAIHFTKIGDRFLICRNSLGTNK